MAAFKKYSNPSEQAPQIPSYQPPSNNVVPQTYQAPSKSSDVNYLQKPSNQNSLQHSLSANDLPQRK